MKKMFLIVLVVMLMIGCADNVTFQEASKIEPVGFWHGIWHGIIAVIAFVGSWFSDDIAIYAIYNNGFWYDLGFLLGLGAIAGGASSTNNKDDDD